MYFRASCAVLFVIGAILPFSFILSPPGVAGPCLPSDPYGVNPGNLCLGFPTHGMSINSNSFRHGYASEGYYGDPTGPTQPGTSILPSHIRGTRVDPMSSVGAGGFWTSIESSDGQTTVRTNTGKEFKLKLTSP